VVTNSLKIFRLGHAVNTSNQDGAIVDSENRDLLKWLRSLRLHKYNPVLVDLTYERFLQLTDEQLEKRGFTLGARGKLLKHISLIKERPQRLLELDRKLETVTDLTTLCQILLELETLILMPTKPLTCPAPMLSSAAHLSLNSTAGRSGGSVTEFCPGSDDDDVPRLMFQVLTKVFHSVFPNCVRHYKVVTTFARILEYCLDKDCFTETEKIRFTSWLKKLPKSRMRIRRTDKGRGYQVGYQTYHPRQPGN